MNLSKRILFFLGLIVLGPVMAIAFYYIPVSNIVEYLGVGSAIAGIGSLIYAFFQEINDRKIKQQDSINNQMQELDKRIDAVSKELADRNLAQEKEISSVKENSSLAAQSYQNVTGQLYSLTEKLNSFQLELSDIKASQIYQSRIAELIKRIDGLEAVLLTQKTED
jgi:chromosome segregation ATPase